MKLLEDYKKRDVSYLHYVQPYWITLIKQSFVFVHPEVAFQQPLNEVDKLNSVLDLNTPAAERSEFVNPELYDYYFAVRCILSGNFSTVEDNLHSFHAMYPTDPVYHYVKMFLGVIFEDFESAEKHIDKAVSLRSDIALFHAFRAYLKCFIRSYPEVIESASFCLESADGTVRAIEIYRYLPLCLYQATTVSGVRSNLQFDNGVLDSIIADSSAHLEELSIYFPEYHFYKRPEKTKNHHMMVMVDSIYFAQWAIPMLLSFFDNSEDVTYHVHLVNPDRISLDKCDILFDILCGNLIVTTENVNYSVYGKTSTYFVAARFCRMFQFSHELSCFQSYTMLDADLLANNRIDDLFNFDEGSASFCYFKDEPLWDSLMGGLCVFHATRVQDLLQWISIFILKNFQSGKADWYLDIVAIVEAVFKFESSSGSNIRYLRAEEYYDLGHRASSKVWAITNDKEAFLYSAKNNQHLSRFNEVFSGASGFLNPTVAGVDPYWIQNVDVDPQYINVNRNVFFAELCKNKKILHVGCADYPITNIENNLHIYLDNYCDIDGCDTQIEALELLRPHVSGKLFSCLDEAADVYDLILIPEVLEHVDNVAVFLKLLSQIKARYIVFTAPDAYLCSRTHFHPQEGSSHFTELNHPDHNYWFSPYTIKNIIHKYTNWKVLKLAFFDQRSILLVAENPNTL